MRINLLSNGNANIGGITIDFSGAGPLAALEFAAMFAQVFDFELDEEPLRAEALAFKQQGHVDLSATIIRGVTLWHVAVDLHTSGEAKSRHSRAKRPFSLLLPEGGRVAGKESLFGTLAEAKRTNLSRAGRGLPLVRVIDWGSGAIFDVPPDADLFALEAVVLAAR